jgi:hypothetical protein
VMNWEFNSSWRVSVAAESITAALFARCGFDVSVQYGANQPEYDLMVAKEEQMLKLSVKGSQDGGWGLCQSYLKQADYHEAIRCWERKHNPRTIFSLVQFCHVNFSHMPRVYLASPLEIGKRLKETAKGRGDTILYESHQWGSRAHGAGAIEEIPANWRFSPERIEALLREFDERSI